MEDAWFLYPGQPFIGEGIINTILACDNDPMETPSASPNEHEKAQIAFAMILIAVESLVQTKLNQNNSKGSDRIENIAKKTLGINDVNDPILNLWNELRIIRNTIIHSGYFEKSKPDNHISIATLKRLVTDFNSNFIDTKTELTKIWKMCYNPLNITRYEAIVAFTFFYWFGKETKTWISNVPLNSAYVDCRLKKGLRNDWFKIGNYYHLVGHGNDFEYLVGYLSGRLPSLQQKEYFQLTQQILDIDTKSALKMSEKIIDMFRKDANYNG